MARLFLTVGGSVIALSLVSGPVAAQPLPVRARALSPPVSRTADASSTNWNAILNHGGPMPDHERLIVVAADGRVLESIDGEASRVILSDALLARLCDEHLSATLLHNHPDSVSLSGADLMQLAKSGVRRVVAVGHDGTVYEASAAAGYDGGAVLARDYDALTEHVKNGTLREGRRGLLDPVVLAPQAPHIAALVLAQLQVITYQVRPSLTLRLLLDRNRAAIDRIVDTEVRRLKADWAAHVPPSSQTARR